MAPFGSCRANTLLRWLLGDASARRAGRLPEWRRRLSSFLIKRLRPVVDDSYDGFRLRLYPGENACDRHIVVSAHHPEEDEFEVLRRILPGCRVFVDVGANIGLYSLLARRLAGPDCRILAVEPHPVTLERLRTNLKLNGYEEAITVEPRAIGAEPGEAVMHAPSRRNIGQNTLRDDLGDKGEAVRVEVLPLADVLRQNGIEKIDIMKIDVEGLEDRALVPYLETAPQASWPDYIMIEKVYEGLWKKDPREFLRAAGYTVAFSNRMNEHFARQIRG